MGVKMLLLKPITIHMVHILDNLPMRGSIILQLWTVDGL